MKTGRTMLIAVLAISLTALVLSCGSDGNSDDGEVKGDISDLSDGAVTEVEVRILDGGILYAVEIELGAFDDDEGDENEPGDDEFEEQFTAPVEAIAEDFSYIVVYGGLQVRLDLEDDDADDDTDDEDEGELAIEDLSVGMWVAVEGLFGDDGLFHADEILAAGEDELEIGAKIADLTDSSFTMLGLTITFDANTQVEIQEGDDDEDGDDADDDD